MKPGYKTSEFWLALISQVLAVLVTVGVLRPGDQAELGQCLSAAITAIFALLTSSVQMKQYIQGRQGLKLRDMDSEQ